MHEHRSEAKKRRIFVAKKVVEHVQVLLRGIKEVRKPIWRLKLRNYYFSFLNHIGLINSWVFFNIIFLKNFIDANAPIAKQKRRLKNKQINKYSCLLHNMIKVHNNIILLYSTYWWLQHSGIHRLYCFFSYSKSSLFLTYIYFDTFSRVF